MNPGRAIIGEQSESTDGPSTLVFWRRETSKMPLAGRTFGKGRRPSSAGKDSANKRRPPSLKLLACDANEACERYQCALGEMKVRLPHTLMLEILSFLDARAIVRARVVARSFVGDAPMLVNALAFKKSDTFPTALGIFTRLTDIDLEGNSDSLAKAVSRIPQCASLRGLRLSLRMPQIAPLSPVAVYGLFSLQQLSDLEIRFIRLAVPLAALPVWRTLHRLVVRDGCIDDLHLANLMHSLPEGLLPLRSLDLSRNPIGEHVKAIGLLTDALGRFPELRSLELAADRISGAGSKLLLGKLLSGACRKLVFLDISLNFLDNDAVAFLGAGLEVEGHGLRSLKKLGIGGRFSLFGGGVTSLAPLASALAVGGLPNLGFFHAQGTITLAHVGPLLRKIKRGACPNLSVLKIERSSRCPHPGEDVQATEDAIQSMWELVTSYCFPRLREVHVLGMGLGRGLEWAEEERTPFYLANTESRLHRLALAGAVMGVMIFM